MSNNNLSNTTSTRDKIEGRISQEKAELIGFNQGGAMAFTNASDVMEFAKMMSVSGVAIPKHLRESPGACMAVCIQASEWRMSPFAVANKSYSVNDRLAYESQLINAVILRRAPIVGRFKIDYTGDGQKRQCKVSVKGQDGETYEYTSPEFASIPVKNSPLWKSDPDQQLFYYSSRAMCRRHFPDVLLGVYTMDEIEDEPQQQMRTVSSSPHSNPFVDEPEAEAPAIEVEPVESAPAKPDAEAVLKESKLADW